MDHLLLFLAGLFFLVYLGGLLLEKFRIPWIFAALLLGLGLAAYNPFTSITSAPTFEFLAQLGMYFLLFIIGFEIDLKEILGSNNLVLKTTAAVILAESFFGSILIHFVFGTPWPISILVATSFSTVGEAVLLPILDEFKLTKTKLGQTILGIGVLDDLVEVITVIVASFFISSEVGHGDLNITGNLLTLLSLFVLAFVIFRFHKKIIPFKYKDISALFLLLIFIMFVFVGIGQFVDAEALGALLAGIALKNAIPPKLLSFIDSEVRTMAYGLFAPIFFVWVGLETDIGYLVQFPLLILLVMAMSNSTKMITSYFMTRKEIGPKNALILGMSITVKFSTSIVIIKLLLDKGLIHEQLYSVLIGTMILFKFIIPVLLSYLIKKWKISPEKA